MSVSVPTTSEPTNMPIGASEPISPMPAGFRPHPGSASSDGTTAPKTTTS